MQEIGILFTRYPDPLSSMVRQINRGRFTHVSISIDDSMEKFYSFNFKGFSEETYEKYMRIGVMDSCLYTLNVSDLVQSYIDYKINKFLEMKEKLQYSKLGVLLCALHIPLDRENKYFCSEFVAETLQQSKAVEFNRKPQLCFPNHLARIMDKQECNIEEHFIV